MRACKKDLNHDEIERIFKAFGWITIDTSSCHGILLDFIAYRPNGNVWFIEVKNGSGKPLTKDEQRFFKDNPERSIVIYSNEKAVDFCKRYRDGFNAKDEGRF
jgi:hypothetical protein